MTIKADDRSVYGKKMVSFLIPLGRESCSASVEMSAERDEEGFRKRWSNISGLGNSFRCSLALVCHRRDGSNSLSLVSSQADGIICVKTGQAVLVAEYVTPTPTGEATKIVEGVSHFFRAFAELSLIVSPPTELGDYLLGVGF